MDRRYGRNGKFTAQQDFRESPSRLMEAIVEGYEAATKAIRVGTFSTSPDKKFLLDYLETGLKLLGFGDAACLVKRDFARSALILAEILQGKKGIG